MADPAVNYVRITRQKVDRFTSCEQFAPSYKFSLWNMWQSQPWVLAQLLCNSTLELVTYKPANTPPLQLGIFTPNLLTGSLRLRGVKELFQNSYVGNIRTLGLPESQIPCYQKLDFTASGILSTFPT